MHAMQQAIALNPGLENSGSETEFRVHRPEIQLLSSRSLDDNWILDNNRQRAIICPLTLNFPDSFQFAHRAIYDACRNRDQMRSQAQTEGVEIGDGNFWLPIVWTIKGPLYAEVIGVNTASSNLLDNQISQSLTYQQPVHMGDRWRQSLYFLGKRLLSSLTTPPGVYLLQFGLRDNQFCFDCLFPFPAIPAIASIGVQTPDLFVCHWRCLINQPILDLTIPGTQPFQSISGEIFQPSSRSNLVGGITQNS